LSRPDALIYILFKTELVSVIMTCAKVHSSRIGDRLLELSAQEEEVQDFLNEMVDGWSEYRDSLVDYNRVQEGSLLVDPRVVDAFTMPALMNQKSDRAFKLGLNSRDRDSNEDEDEDEDEDEREGSDGSDDDCCSPKAKISLKFGNTNADADADAEEEYGLETCKAKGNSLPSGDLEISKLMNGCHMEFDSDFNEKEEEEETPGSSTNFNA
jgi:hypothetical protein